MLSRRLLLAATGLASALAAAGCGGEAERTVECAQICEKYDECVRDIDVIACTDACEDVAQQDRRIATRAGSCEVCVDDATCSEAEACWSNCPVVPNAETELRHIPLAGRR
jgi:hypothetical protein